MPEGPAELPPGLRPNRPPRRKRTTDRQTYLLRVEAVARMIAYGLTRGEIKARVRAAYGPTPSGTIDYWIARARGQVVLMASGLTVRPRVWLPSLPAAKGAKAPAPPADPPSAT